MDQILIKKKRKRVKLHATKHKKNNMVIIENQEKQLHKNKYKTNLKKDLINKNHLRISNKRRKDAAEKSEFSAYDLNRFLNDKCINLENIPIKNIKFEVDSWSSYISNFHPKNICVDSKISGQLSKWSVDFKSQNEFVFFKLEKTSIINSITFGKFRDPTNLKEFKILAGLNKTDMIEILHSGLSHDMEYEPFTVKKDYKGFLIPCK